jgi:hypothetical protein
VRITSEHPQFGDDDVARALAGLPDADGYEIIVRPLRYRAGPHLAAYTIFDDATITLQIPEPFMPFGEIVVWGSKRVAAKGMKFIPMSEGVTFRSRAEVARYLYCHEWYHWYLHVVHKKGTSGEIACDRFALHNFRKRVVTLEDARAALRRARV